MAKTTVSDTIVLADDELQHMLWVFDYFEARSVKVISAVNVNEAIERVEEEVYRALIIDLNIPVLEPYEAAVRELGAVYVKFPGLFVARAARNKGYRDRQVVIYSAHKDGEVSEEARRLGCTYIIKGRPREIKSEFESVLSFDPTAG